MSVLFPTVRALQVTLKRGVWSMEQAPGASLGRMGKPKQASYEQPQKHFCWDMFSVTLFLRVFLSALLSQPCSPPFLSPRPAGSSSNRVHPSRDLLSLGTGWITTSLGLVVGLSCFFLLSKRIFTKKRQGWEFLPHLADFCVLVSTGATVGWGGAALFLGQSRGSWSPLNDPDVVQLSLCPLAAFPLSPKSGVTWPSPSKTDWVTQACWLLPVAHGSGQRCHCGCLQWDEQGQQL